MAVGEKPKFTIVGSGLAGSLMAVYLARAGYEVELFEKRQDLRQGKVGPGRSINLALSVRGIHALERAGLADAILSEAVPMPGRMMHGIDGSLSFQPYSKNSSDVINSVSRGRLNSTLLDAAEACPGATIRFNERCTDVDLDRGVAFFENAETNERTASSGEILIGADGAFSAVRAAMQKRELFNYEQSYLAHGYKELHIPPAEGGGHRMERDALHIWPRRSYMMIALPNLDGSFTCTLFWPLEGRISFDALKADDDIRRFFGEHFGDAVPHLPTLVEDYQRNPVGTLVTIRCAPWHVDDRAVLIGDAAHAIVPFYGQGINCGFEDCEVLMDCIEQYAPDWRRVFAEYSDARKPHADTIADLAIANFIEMRDHVGSPAFLRKKKRERLLDRYFPNYLPLYSMVTFSRIPYADAVGRAVRQEHLVRNTVVGTAFLLLAILVVAFAWLI